MIFYLVQQVINGAPEQPLPYTAKGSALVSVSKLAEAMGFPLADFAESAEDHAAAFWEHEGWAADGNPPHRAHTVQFPLNTIRMWEIEISLKNPLLASPKELNGKTHGHN